MRHGEHIFPLPSPLRVYTVRGKGEKREKGKKCLAFPYASLLFKSRVVDFPGETVNHERNPVAGSPFAASTADNASARVFHRST